MLMTSPLQFGLTHIQLTNFRNYSQIELAIYAPVIVITGPNGAGKTNILEALSLFAPGRGLRNVKLSQMSQMGQNNLTGFSWVVNAQAQQRNDQNFFATGLELSPTGSEKRLVKINHTLARAQAELTEYFGMVWVTPAMATLFIDAASVRRKFMDRMASALDAAHAQRLHRYEHYVRERSTLLREGRQDPIWLDQLERKIAEDGIAITIARQQLAQALESSQSDMMSSPFPKFQATMTGVVDQWCQEMPALKAEQKLTEALAKSRHEDAQGGTLFGPNKSDLAIVHLAKCLPAELCSTGEQKMLLLALTLAFVKYQAQQHQRNVILLLDDVVAHLDDNHRDYLFNEVQRYAGRKHNLQVWLTGTSADDFAPLNDTAQFVHIEQATVING
jgi:DNA replication and repair protein RecF